MRTRPIGLPRRFGYLALVAALGGCVTRWEAQPGPVPFAVANARSNTPLRVTRRDGSQVVLQNVTIQGDTLIGYADLDQPLPAYAPRTTVPLGDVSTISQREPDVGASVAIGTAAALIVIYLSLTVSGPIWGD